MSVAFRHVHSLVPRWFYGAAALGVCLTMGPFVGLALAIPWGQLSELVSNPQVQQASILSIKTATASTLVCIILGVPLALLLARVLPRTRWATISNALYALIYAPVVLSPVVSGLALVYFWGRKGLVGQWLNGAGIPITFTPTAVVLAQVFVALPFFVATYVNVLRTVPVEFEEIALTEGASPYDITFRVLLPVTGFGLATAALMSFARALGEYGATLMFAGNLEGRTRTLPLNIELMLSSSDSAGALGSALVMIAIYLILIGFFALTLIVRKKGS